VSKTAVVTGATSGLGGAFAKRLAAQGFNLIVTGRRQEKLQQLAADLTKEYKIEVYPILAELCSDQDLQKLIEAIRAKGSIEILINNAGFAGNAPNWMAMDQTTSEQMINLHQIVPMKLISIVVPEMIRQGKGTIINVASMGAFMPNRRSTVYGATKAFLVLFSESLHLELKSKGIKVQALCPGFIDTDFFRNYSAELKKQIFTQSKPASPEAVVDYSIKCLKRKNQVICMPPGPLKNLFGLSSFMPRTMLYSLVESRDPTLKTAPSRSGR
jgi:uncharacterized protein